MKEVFIKYNPYKLKTEITIDGKTPKDNSALNVKEKHLQEWIEDLPRILREEENDNQFKLTFHGTIPDYEDVVSIDNVVENVLYNTNFFGDFFLGWNAGILKTYIL
ncbi:hypothetical protein AGMMS49991_09940 [Spirochaetia bacterium]|nr:hypothetical protein AGMMS49991_09940 [Spirochaetia bacterium]